MIVRELMTTDPVTVRPDTAIKAAVVLLDDNNITSLPVVNAAGRIVGVVSEADLIRDVIGPDPRLHEIPAEEPPIDRPRFVGDVMTPHAIAVRPETDLVTAVDIATSTGIKSLPVLDGEDRVVGMLSRRDVVRMLARRDAVLEQDIDTLLCSTGVRSWLVDVHDGVAEITGPANRHERVLARVLAGSVPGIVEVRVE